MGLTASTANCWHYAHSYICIVAQLLSWAKNDICDFPWTLSILSSLLLVKCPNDPLHHCSSPSASNWGSPFRLIVFHVKRQIENYNLETNRKLKQIIIFCLSLNWNFPFVSHTYLFDFLFGSPSALSCQGFQTYCMTVSSLALGQYRRPWVWKHQQPAVDTMLTATFVLWLNCWVWPTMMYVTLLALYQF